MPFVPIIGYVPGSTINPQLGYELWTTHQLRSVPYILEIESVEYQKLPTDSLGGHYCKVCDSYINIPPLALYATMAEAKSALGFFTPVRTREQLDAAR
jgi:hypothetical protein